MFTDNTALNSSCIPKILILDESMNLGVFILWTQVLDNFIFEHHKTVFIFYTKFIFLCLYIHMVLY